MTVKDLVDKRKDILFAEIGALIHDLGKLSKEFVEYYVLPNSSKTWDKDYHANILFPQNVLCIKEIYKTIWFEYLSANYAEVEKKLLLLLKSFINNQIGNSEEKEILKRLKIQKNGVVKTFDQLKSTLSSKGKPYKNSQLGNNIDLILNDLLDPLIELQILYNNYHNVSHFLEHSQLFTEILGWRLNNESFSLGNFIAEHHFKSCYSKTISLLISRKDGADGIDSAIDKMVTNHNIAKQSKDHTYISTAFGYENQKIDLSLPDTNNNSLTKIRNDYAVKLANILNDLKNLNNNPQNIQNWIEKREELLRETKQAFLNALGETRRPANDVTLWDHSFSVASLYKSALAEVIVKEWKEPKEIKWKLLSIRFDGNNFYNAAPKIADVLGRKALVKKILDNIKILLEVIIPIGSEIYRDENGSVFLVPESSEGDKILDLSNNVWNSIKDIELEADLDYMGNWNKKTIDSIVSNPSNIKELIENLSSRMSEGILIPQITLSEPSRGALNIGKVISESQKHKIDLQKLKEKWQGKEEGYEKCTVCNLKPVPLTWAQYESIKSKTWSVLTDEEKDWFDNDNKNFVPYLKAFERKECPDCLKLSSNRVEEWHKNERWNKENPEKPSFDTSIWLDEIADENNRIGLIYLKFDLEKWLNGEMLNTFFSNPLLEEDFKKQFENELFNVPDYNKLIELIEEAFNKNDFNHNFSITKKDGNNLKVKELFQILVGNVFANSPIELFNSIVENREPDWKERYPCPPCATQGDYKHKAIMFLLLTTRKHPSFARLRRIWETTKKFGIEMFEKAKNSLTEKKRIVLEFNNSPNLKITHTYYFKDKYENKGEIVVLDKNKASVISTSKDLKLKSGDSLEIYNDKYFNEFIDTITINNFSENSFKPIISYQFEPSNTMFFVPLKDKTWEIINEIKKQYEIQFNKVQNRLPIKIGFVAFHKRTPMYAVLDATKRLMLQKESSVEVLEICNITEMDSQKNCQLHEGKIGNKVKEIKLENGETYHFSYSTGDPNKEDLFHPYFVIQNNNGWKVPVNGEWKTIKHVKHLQKGDKVEFYPSYFDFLYLDTNTRRLDVGKERKHWLFKGKSPKPYRLKEIEEFERLRELLLVRLKLTPSQLLNAYELLIDKMQHWEIDKTDKLPIEDSIFKDFVENIILSNPFRLKIKSETGKGQITERDFEFLKNAILNGVFFDFIDMWHTVLKRKFNEED